MDHPRQSPLRERCAEHDLAVGPGGSCVLCRRGRVRLAEPSRWLPRVLFAAGLGSTLLGGVALARTRAPAPVQAAVTEMVPRGQAPLGAAPPCPTTVTRPREVPSIPVPVPPPPTARVPEAPPRDYLGEAYAAMPKGDLYSENEGPLPVSLPSHPACGCREGGCQPRYYYGSYVNPPRVVPSPSYRGGVPGGPSVPVGPVPRTSGSPAMMVSRGAGGRR